MTHERGWRERERERERHEEEDEGKENSISACRAVKQELAREERTDKKLGSKDESKDGRINGSLVLILTTGRAGHVCDTCDTIEMKAGGLSLISSFFAGTHTETLFLGPKFCRSSISMMQLA